MYWYLAYRIYVSTCIFYAISYRHMQHLFLLAFEHIYHVSFILTKSHLEVRKNFRFDLGKRLEVYIQERE